TDKLLLSRDVFWIIGGLAGSSALALLLMQPLLAAGYLPLPSPLTSRRWHRWVGSLIVAAVAVHIGSLYVSSPEDTMDALLLVAPTSFSVYGVIGLVSVALTAILVAFRTRSGLRYGAWRILHNALGLVVVGATIAHALLIDGAMGTVSKTMLCALVFIATSVVLFRTHVKKRAGATTPPAGP
ncbi:MAG: ferric reductase-like transmembrane domain-containing protein, partial [Bosea sp. (in: a-proteobacteria)]